MESTKTREIKTQLLETSVIEGCKYGQFIMDTAKLESQSKHPVATPKQLSCIMQFVLPLVLLAV